MARASRSLSALIGSNFPRSGFEADIYQPMLRMRSWQTETPGGESPERGRGKAFDGVARCSVGFLHRRTVIAVHAVPEKASITPGGERSSKFVLSPSSPEP